MLYIFSFKTNLGSQYLPGSPQKCIFVGWFTVITSVRLVCTLSQHSVGLMTRFVINLRGCKNKAFYNPFLYFIYRRLRKNQTGR